MGCYWCNVFVLVCANATADENETSSKQVAEEVSTVDEKQQELSGKLLVLPKSLKRSQLLKAGC